MHVSDGYRFGDFFGRHGNAIVPGVQLAQAIMYDIVPPAISTTAVAAAQAVAGAGNLTINGANAAGGVATFTAPRAVDIVSSNAGDTTQTALIRGVDIYNIPMSELIAFNGTNRVAGKKAFWKVTSAFISAALAGNGSVGSTDVLGLPFMLTDLNYITKISWASAIAQPASTVVKGDGTTATTTTGDVRGTISNAGVSATDGARRLTVTWLLPSADLENAIFGVPQA